MGNSHKSANIQVYEEKLKQLRNHVCTNYYVSLEDYADEDFLVDYYPFHRGAAKPSGGKRRRMKDEDKSQTSEALSKLKSRRDSRNTNSGPYGRVEETKTKRDTRKQSSEFENKCDEEESSDDEYNINSMKKVFRYERKRQRVQKTLKTEPPKVADKPIPKETPPEVKIESMPVIKNKQIVELSDDESIFEDAEESAPKGVVKTSKESVYKIDGFIITEKYHEINTSGFMENSSVFSSDSEKNEYRLVKEQAKQPIDPENSL